MKILKKITTHIVIVGLCLTTIAPGAISDAKAKKPKLSKKNVTITKGKTKKIKLSRAGKKAKVTWKVSKKKIIKLTKKKKTYCKVKGLKKGSATLTCKVKIGKKPYKLKCKVKVKNKKVVNTPSIINTYKNIVPYMGAAVNYGSYSPRELRTAKTLSFIKKHFNSFTLENEMKPDNILGSSATTLTVAQAKSKGYYIPQGYTEATVPQLNFNEVDGALTVAAKNGLKMRAHTLVWHSQTPGWFFTKNYDGSSTVSTEIMDARLDFYVHNVMEHVMNKEKALTGSAGSIVYAWDVVNEYLHRFSFGQIWDTVYGNQGSSPSYVKKAFEIAYEVLKSYGVQDKVTLFYNDYNTYFGVQDTLNLVDFINKDEPAKICGGIGMQSHVDVKVPTVKEYGDALEKFLAAGYEIQITELDFTINFDTDGSSPSYSYADENETATDQKKFVKNLMETIIKKQKNRNKTVNPKGITSITLWGLYDSTSWRSQCEPLLFGDSITDPKPSFYAFIEAAKVW
ncbi:MAG: endo-1,4-beta-xylanase [Lachnospiraceae bacterium]|nr:endo-1,4-beta-xylanase [Lachnospiraceae bacterium]